MLRAHCLPLLALLAVATTGSDPAEGIRPVSLAPPTAASATPAEAEPTFEALHERWSDRFCTAVTALEDRVDPDHITALAADLWNEVFGPYPAVVARRASEILEAVPMADPVRFDAFTTVSENEPASGREPRPPAAIHRLWNPVAAADEALGGWLHKSMVRRAWRKWQAMCDECPLQWRVVDRDPASPQLIAAQGPMVYVVRLRRTGNVYLPVRLTWLRAKDLGPVRHEPLEPQPTPPATETAAGDTGEAPAAGAEPASFEAPAARPGVPVDLVSTSPAPAASNDAEADADAEATSEPGQP